MTECGDEVALHRVAHNDMAPLEKTLLNGARLLELRGVALVLPRDLEWIAVVRIALRRVSIGKESSPALDDIALANIACGVLLDDSLLGVHVVLHIPQQRVAPDHRLDGIAEGVEMVDLHVRAPPFKADAPYHERDEAVAQLGRQDEQRKSPWPLHWRSRPRARQLEDALLIHEAAAHAA